MPVKGYRKSKRSEEKTGQAFVIATLRKAFPHGHRGFVPMLVEYMDLHSRKNGDYAKGGPALGNFLRVWKILSLYPGLDPSDPAVVSMLYMLKQLDAYLWMKAQKYEGQVEGKAARLGDVTVYSAIARLIEEDPDEAPARCLPARCIGSRQRRTR